jgi:hypothetical protein
VPSILAPSILASASHAGIDLAGEIRTKSIATKILSLRRRSPAIQQHDTFTTEILQRKFLAHLEA